jgi:hypothetical protein
MGKKQREPRRREFCSTVYFDPQIDVTQQLYNMPIYRLRYLTIKLAISYGLS